MNVDEDSVQKLSSRLAVYILMGFLDAVAQKDKYKTPIYAFTFHLFFGLILAILWVWVMGCSALMIISHNNRELIDMPMLMLLLVVL